MANKQRADMPRSPGRPKGSQNKVTGIAKDAIATAADKLGGADRLVAWAKEDPANERAFWSTIYPKLIPVQLNHADADGDKLILQVVRFADNPAT